MDIGFKKNKQRGQDFHLTSLFMKIECNQEKMVDKDWLERSLIYTGGSFCLSTRMESSVSSAERR